MQVFNHHIYEFKKGVRDMVLCTLSANLEDKVIAKLERNGICYMIQRLRKGNINVFFGKEECLVVINKLCKNRSLDQLSPEEDFMIGTLLGYSVCEQCRRYCKRKKTESEVIVENM
ncbi:DUF2023 family protein [Dysgonomonas macrotermitis]|uniref:DUF2023 domain-containing protein n=1 Tax=Dysgonomonas macrotermitis TaxID=1346286 RepID=A0A1M5HUT5_9BACT|nr:DUF2023 family protein [Dysgonomonas macrotermitis]SHG19657.1 Protein of unknown function [Dysgonomonas macrotermitis]